MAAATAILATHGVSKLFGAFAAVSNVSIEVRSGEVRGLIGPNGAGKSTLLHVLAGRHEASAGRILFEGRDITRLQPRQRARLGMGIKFQITSVVNGATVEENVMLAAQAREPWWRLFGGADAECRDEVATLIEQVGLAAKRKWLAGWLSHGEQQWLEIAMVLGLRPRVLLLDEPTSGMSVRETLATAELIDRLRANLAVVVVEHDIAFIKLISDRLTVLNRGEVLAEGTVAEVEQNELVQAAYLRRGSLGHRVKVA
jgi:branched-chain amino acid transport system ATP-binding protein